MSEVTDSICKLLGDQNAKIQLNTMERLQSALPSLRNFVEANIVQFFSQLCQCLASMNASVRRAGEATLCKVYENVNRSLLVQPMCNEIQYSQSARLKPILIDHLSGKFFKVLYLLTESGTRVFLHLPYLCRLRERQL